MDICENKLSIHNIPKKYLTDKTFSYKLYLNLCYIAFWKYDLDTEDDKFIEYRLYGYNLKQLSDISKLNRDTIRTKIAKLPYRDKIDNTEITNDGDLIDNYKFTRTKHLMFNSPKTNYTKVELEVLSKLTTLEELTIRLYVLIQGYKYDEIYGASQKCILESLGYSSKSHNNFSKLTQSANKLKELELIDYVVLSDGSIKYIKYYKINK